MNAPVPTFPVPPLRREALAAPTSGIVDVFNYGRTREGLIPLWVGEGDLPTPAFICAAAARSLQAGETFYTYQRGLPDLRRSLARYIARLYGRPSDPERFFVTSGGMHAIQVAVRMICGDGDEVVVPSPAWPNFVGAMTIAGASAVAVPLAVDEAGWHLDLERIAAAITPRTRAIFVNSPANPTGWTATEDDLKGILSLARTFGLWIVADEIYGRFVYDGAPSLGERAASFRDVMGDDDRVLFVQTFSKNWAMTGWRIGWIEAPSALGQVIENLIQYSSSGTPVFAQRAAITALEEGEAFVREQIARAARGREIVGRLARSGRIELPAPAGAFYAFLKVCGFSDSRSLAFRLIDEANVGLAPGDAFGAAGEGYLRLCFARRASDLEEAVARIERMLRP